MHFGNFKKHKIDNEDRLVVYDFGFCFDVIDINIVHNLDDCWHSMLDHKEAKNSFKYCIEYIIKYHIESTDIEIYEDIIDDIFLKEKIV